MITPIHAEGYARVFAYRADTEPPSDRRAAFELCRQMCDAADHAAAYGMDAALDRMRRECGGEL